MMLTATLRDAATGQPLAGRTVIFTLGSQTTAAPTELRRRGECPAQSGAGAGTTDADREVRWRRRLCADASDAVVRSRRRHRWGRPAGFVGGEWRRHQRRRDDRSQSARHGRQSASQGRLRRSRLDGEAVEPCVWLVCWTNGGVLQPQRVVLDTLVARFAAAPVSNPDGSTGITLHVDGGPDTVMNPVTGEPWGPFSGAGVVPYDALLGNGTPSANTTGRNSTRSSRCSSNPLDARSFTMPSTRI